MWHTWGRREIVVGNPEGKRLLGRHRNRQQDNIKIDGRISNVIIWIKIGTTGGLL
jgi:hypothetical protein